MKKLLNLKRLLKKRNNGGFTLIEVIISCLLLSILVLGVMSFVTPVMNMVSLGKKNARATMLAETIDSYISGSLKNAEHVAVFYNMDMDMTTSGATALKAATSDTEGLNLFNTFMTTGDNAANYEVRCISISWGYDSITGHQKLLVYNETVDNNFSLVFPQTMSTTGFSKVFNDVMYDGLYPIVSVETFQNEAGVNANGYKISTKVYADDKCYCTVSETERKKSHLAFEGVTFVECLNMVTPAFEPCQVKSLQAAMDAKKGSHGYISKGSLYYYPDIYIYYIVHK